MSSIASGKNESSVSPALPGRPGSRFAPFAWGLLAVVVATLVREALDSYLGTQVAFGFYFIAILVVARYVGRWPALMVFALGALCGTYFLTEPHGTYELVRTRQTASLVSYLIVGLVGFVVTNSFRNAWRKAAAAAGDAQAKQDQLTHEIAIRRKAEDALTRYRLLAESARDIVLFVRASDGRILDANAAAENAYGFTRSELTAHTIADLRDPSTNKLVPAQLAEAASHGIRFDTVHRRADGTTFAVEVSSRGEDFGGERIVLSLIRDISDRAAADAARAALAAIVESSTDAIIGLALDGKITSWNRAAEGLYGYTAAEVVGRSVHILLPPGRLDEEAYILGRLRRGEVLDHYESRRQTKDGRIIDVSLTASPIRDASGQIVGASKIARDITEKKRAEEALRRQNVRLRVLSNTVRHLLSGDRPRDFVPVLFDELAVALDLGVYLHYRVSDDGSELVLDSAAGLPDEWASSFARIPFGQAISGAVALTRERRVVERIADSTDPALDPYRGLGLTGFVCHPLTASGRLLGVLGFGSRTRATFDADDLALLQSVCDQVGLAIERVELLEQSRRQAEQLADADRRKDEFLAMLAHELRNPLAPVRNAVQVLRLLGPDDARLVSARDMIDRQVGHLTRLVDDLLDVSRITRGKITLQMRRCDLRSVLRRAAESVRPLIDGKRHQLDLALPAAPIWVDGDETRLAQVVDNLLTNAAKYTDAGGQIHLTLAAENGSGVVRVIDNGTGVPPEILPRMFDLFAQAERTLDRSQGGLGIGLALVKRLVEMHAGTVEATSAGPGQGSEFTVRLPLVSGPVLRAASPATPAATAEPSPSMRVLVVDDNVDAAESLCTLLGMLGHETAVAFDGPTGLAAAMSFQPQVAILDIGLPGISGYEMARQMRSEPGSLTLLIAMSGYGQEEDRRKSQEAGFHHHLTKPVELAVLKGVLARAPAATADPVATP